MREKHFALIYAGSGRPSVMFSFTTGPSAPIPVAFRMLTAVDDHYE